MHAHRRVSIFMVFLLGWAGAFAADLPVKADVPAVLAEPVEEGPWIRPAVGVDARPVWGVKGGIQIGLWPTPGPRGLIRIHTPYLGQDPGVIMNFIAVEPVVGHERGYSEMEHSAWDGGQGRMMWSGDDEAAAPAVPWRPARGVEGGEAGARTLTLVVGVEPFANGARSAVRITLREDRPHELELCAIALPGSASIDRCILTATMGNYARLRTLHLAWGPRQVGDVFPIKPADGDFTGQAAFPVDQLMVRDGQVFFAATPDEADPVNAVYEPGGWTYQGAVATQYWIADAAPDVRGVVNGRTTYWMTRSHIPGGLAIENFELDAGYRPGRVFRFGITPGGLEAVVGR